jgi:hypothetical protein
MKLRSVASAIVITALATPSPSKGQEASPPAAAILEEFDVYRDGDFLLVPVNIHLSKPRASASGNMNRASRSAIRTALPAAQGSRRIELHGRVLGAVSHSPARMAGVDNGCHTPAIFLSPRHPLRGILKSDKVFDAS